MDRFDIVLTGLEEAGAPANPAHALAETFGIGRDRAEELLSRAPVTVKRNVDSETAERYFHALRAIGVTVELRKCATDSPPPAQGGGRPPSLEPPPQSVSPAPAPLAVAATATATAPAPAPTGPYRGPRELPLASAVHGPFVPRLLGTFAHPFQRAGLPVLFGVGVTVHLFLLLAWWGSHAPLL